MTDQQNKTQEQNATQFMIQRIYIKDISFETPNAPAIFTKEWKPEVTLELNSSSTLLSEDVYEVTLRLTITTKSNDEVAYICEVTQAGIFTTKGIEGVNLQHCLNAFCPNILFPYARETVANLVNKGTYHPLNLEPVNFDALFMDYLQKQKQEQEIPQAESDKLQ